MAAEPREAADDVLRVGGLQLEERAVVDHGLDHALDVVRLVGSVGDQRVELWRLAIDRVGGLRIRRRLEVRLRQEREQVAGVLDARSFVGGDEVGDTGFRGVRARPTEVLEAHVLACDRLHDVGAGDEHVRRALRHQHEVRDRRRVDGAAGAGSHDQRDLRNDTRRLHVPPEDLGVARERDDPFLDARAAGVVHPNDRAADLDGQVHHLADLLGKDLGEGAAEDREVLAEDADRPAEDRPVAGHDGVAPRPLLAHAELALAVAHEPVQLDERAPVEQELDPLTGEELASLVLSRDGLLAARVLRGVAQLAEPGELRLGRVVPGRHPGGA